MDNNNISTEIITGDNDNDLSDDDIVMLTRNGKEKTKFVTLDINSRLVDVPVDSLFK